MSFVQKTQQLTCLFDLCTARAPTPHLAYGPVFTASVVLACLVRFARYGCFPGFVLRVTVVLLVLLVSFCSFRFDVLGFSTCQIKRQLNLQVAIQMSRTWREDDQFVLPFDVAVCLTSENKALLNKNMNFNRSIRRTYNVFLHVKKASDSIQNCDKKLKQTLLWVFR